MSRFDYVKYDKDHTSMQLSAKSLCMQLETEIDSLDDGRPKSLALTKLEECYMWIGKAIRDDQVARGSGVDTPERSNI